MAAKTSRNLRSPLTCKAVRPYPPKAPETSRLWAEAQRAVLGAPLPNWAPRVAAGLAAFPGRIDILLAEGDMTAQRFEAAWAHREFRSARAKADLNLTRIATDSHSFVPDDAYQQLRAALLAGLGRS